MNEYLYIIHTSRNAECQIIYTKTNPSINDGILARTMIIISGNVGAARANDVSVITGKRDIRSNRIRVTMSRPINRAARRVQGKLSSSFLINKYRVAVVILIYVLSIANAGPLNVGFFEGLLVVLVSAVRFVRMRKSSKLSRLGSVITCEGKLFVGR